MTMELGIVILIVAAATGYVGRVFYKGVKQKQGCACGCTCCDITESCSPPPGTHCDDAMVQSERKAGGRPQDNRMRQNRP